MRVHWCVLGLALPTHAAAAQPAELTTMLHLSASATVKVAPDQLVAYLDGVTTAATPADAQHMINAMMAQANATAAGVPSVTASFRDYSVGYADEKKTRWTTAQTLELRSAEADTLLELIGRLQGAGLVLDGLEWRVSPPRADQARRSASETAL